MQIIAEPIMQYVPWLNTILPWGLLMPLGKNLSLAAYLVMGRSLPTVIPIVATALWCVLFTGVAIWRFRREEF